MLGSIRDPQAVVFIYFRISSPVTRYNIAFDGSGPDAMSLALPAVVRLVVFFSSG